LKTRCRERDQNGHRLRSQLWVIGSSHVAMKAAFDRHKRSYRFSMGRTVRETLGDLRGG
jgi:hypothetical protein